MALGCDVLPGVQVDERQQLLRGALEERPLRAGDHHAVLPADLLEVLLLLNTGLQAAASS